MLTYLTITIIVIMVASLIKAFLLNGDALWFLTWQISFYVSVILFVTVLEDMSNSYRTDEHLDFYSKNTIEGNNLDCLKHLAQAHKLMTNSTAPSNKLFLKDSYEGVCNFKERNDL